MTMITDTTIKKLLVLNEQISQAKKHQMAKYLREQSYKRPSEKQQEQEEQKYWIEESYIKAWRKSAKLIIQALESRAAHPIGKEAKHVIENYKSIGQEIIELYSRTLFVNDPELMLADKGDCRKKIFGVIGELWQRWRFMPEELIDGGDVCYLNKSIDKLERDFWKTVGQINKLLKLETARKKENKSKQADRNEIIRIAKRLIGGGCKPHKIVSGVRDLLPRDISVQHISSILKEEGFALGRASK